MPIVGIGADGELITLNKEMITRNAELSRLNSDLNNLHLSINTAILVVGRDLKIRRFTPAAEKAFNLVATDLGRPIRGIRSAINFSGLESLVLEVIDRVALREREVQDHAGRWYLLRIRPYVTVENEVDGVVLVLIDIDALKRSEQAVARARDFSNSILRTARDSLLVLSADLRVSQANEAFYRLFQTTPGKTEGKLFFRLGRQWNQQPELRALLAALVKTNKAFNGFELSVEVPKLGRRTLLLHGRLMVDDDKDASRQYLLSMEDITDWLRTGEASRANEIRFRRLFETSREGILLVDPTTRKILDANPCVATLLGCAHAELIGRELFQIGLLPDKAASLNAFHKLRRQGSLRYEHLQLRGLNGEPRHVEVVCNLYVENGVKIAQCNIRDITARKLSEKLVLEQERFIFALIEQSPIGTFVVDDKLIVLQINPVALKTLGHLGPIVGCNYAEIVEQFWEPEAARDVIQKFHTTLETGTTFIAPAYTGRRFDEETEEFFDWQLQRITRPDGRHCVVSYFSDVTQRIRGERKLAAQTRWAELLSRITSQLILTAAPNASLASIFKQLSAELGVEVFLHYSVSRDGRRMNLESSGGIESPHLERLAEVSVAEGLGASALALEEQTPLAAVAADPHPDFETLREIGAKAYLTHPLRSGPSLLGVLILVSLSRSGFDSEEVNFIRTVCDLAAATVERTRLMKDTEKARDVAQTANKTKDDFLGAVSHELRTPLNPVLLLASERTEDKTLTEEVRADFEIIARNVALESRLIDDLLDLTRAAHSKLALHMSVVDLQTILTEAVGIVQTELRQKQIELTVTVKSSNAIVRGDPLRLQQVFWNVLRNGVKFTPQGGTISVVIETSANKERIYVSVTDSGIGMTEDELTRVFARFAQGDHAKPGGSLRFGGLGLGLAISRMLVEAHRGTIEASSAGRDLGTTFLVDLPMAGEADTATFVAAPKKPAASSPRQIPVKRRLLLVEDHDATRFALTSLLTRRGYSVLPAVSITEARLMLKQQEFDVLVCDIGLPDGSGYDLMAELKETSSLRGIALTGYGSESDIARSMEVGFSSHVTKPVSIQALSRALSALEVP